MGSKQLPVVFCCVVCSIPFEDYTLQGQLSSLGNVDKHVLLYPVLWQRIHKRSPDIIQSKFICLQPPSSEMWRTEKGRLKL